MTIPKVVFQTSPFKQPNYLLERLRDKCINWEYKHFLEEDIIEFIEKNPINEFKNSVEVYKIFENVSHKIDFFKYYYLYIHGGIYLESRVVLEKDLDLVINNCHFVTVNSGLNNDSMFTGFIGAGPKHPIILEALKQLYNVNLAELKNDHFLISKQLAKIIDNYKNITSFIGHNEQNKIKIFNEKMIDDKCAVTRDGLDNILTHYFNNKYIIPSLNPIVKKTYDSNLKNIKIAISCFLPDKLIKLYSNGIHQNILYFAELLLNIGYDVYLIVVDKDVKLCDKNDYDIMLYNKDFKVTKYSDIFSMDFDIVIAMGFQIEHSVLKILKYMNTKIIYYKCGNSYYIDSEMVLYNQHKGKHFFDYFDNNDRNLLDQIWSIPQMTNMNQYYWKTLYRTDCIEVPFVWSPVSIKMAALCHNFIDENELLYKQKETNKSIAIFEPNISIMKWCFPALLVCENAYRTDSSIINRVFLNNTTDKNNSINDFNTDTLNNITKSLDIFQDKKLSVEGRYNTLFFMKNHADIAVSHQFENNLNYLYFDLAWMGWPIVHNASLCKDVGYYYEGFNFEMGGEVLSEVLKSHESNKDEYLTRNRQVIDRYLPSNKELQEKYKTIIEKLFT
jgi:hypothetical protein